MFRSSTSRRLTGQVLGSSTAGVVLLMASERRSAEHAQMTVQSRLLSGLQRRNKATMTTDSGSSSVKQMSFMEWYEGHLSARPVQTKMVTGSFLWGLGDVVAQVMPLASSGADRSSFQYDYMRTGRAAFFGCAIHAPTAHVHYNFLEWLTHRAGMTGNLSTPLFKAFMEQFVYWSWFSNSLYHGAMGAMQGQNPQQIYNRIADVLWETQKAQWVFWIPVQLLNFRFVPVRHQLNVVLVTSVAWTALLSAWYPPEDESKSADDKKQKEASQAIVEVKTE